jgi:hypothetical protein
VDQGEARRTFGAVLAMYDLRSVDGRQVIDVAAEPLAAGIDGPAVVELASIPGTPLTGPFEVNARVASAREELGMPPVSLEALASRAAQGQLRRWQQGLLTDRGIASWAHEAIGHDGPQELQDLVVMDDMLDELPHIDATPESMHADIDAIAATYLDYSDPGAGG